MDVSSSKSDSGIYSVSCKNLKSLPKRLKEKIIDFFQMAKKIGKDDPRKIIHAMKVGLAVTIVSLFYYFQPLYDGFGVSAMWAVFTVVVIFEYTVGATLGKGLNRMLATCIAGFLGVLAHHLAELSGDVGEPLLLGFFGFLVAAILTFMRFFPKLKAKYDYGLMMFILTFSLVAVSGYRDDEVLKLEQQRLTTILIGCWIAILICVCVCPVWNGTELHNLVSSNLDKLANFLQGFGEEYFKTTEEKSNVEKFSRDAYKSVLSSKSTEETNANLATWEPSHGQFRFRHPWKQYLKIGAFTRDCAYKIDALNNCLDSNVQIPVEIQEKIKDSCNELSSELGKALKEIATDMKYMRKTTSPQMHVNKSKAIGQHLKSLLQNNTFCENSNVLDILQPAMVASILIDIVHSVESILNGVDELGSLAHFKSIDNVDSQVLGESVGPGPGPHHVVTITVAARNDGPKVETTPVKQSSN